VARAKEAQPAGDRERGLRDLVEDRFDNNIAAFAKEVAKLTGNGWQSEKKAFYRILEGKPGRLVQSRLRFYAKVLRVSPRSLLEQWQDDESSNQRRSIDDAFATSLLGQIVEEIERNPPVGNSPRLLRLADALRAVADRLEAVAGAQGAERLQG